MSHPIIDCTGQRFGKLVARKMLRSRRTHHIYYVCCCDCGNATIVIGYALRNGNTTSCGCSRIKAFSLDEIRTLTADYRHKPKPT